MLVLALETSTFVASAALFDTTADRVVSGRDAACRTHAERLLPLIDELLGEADVRLADIGGFACGAGPGSFTGLRAALATTKGFCYALRRPFVLVPSLLALAAPARAAAGEALIAALLDARRGEVYAGLFRPTAAGLVHEGVERALAPEGLAGLGVGRGPVVVVGDGALAYPEAAAALGPLLPGVRPTPGAEAVARLAAPRLVAGEGDDLLRAAPTYVRASEAERVFPDGVPGSARRTDI